MPLHIILKMFLYAPVNVSSWQAIKYQYYTQGVRGSFDKLVQDFFHQLSAEFKVKRIEHEAFGGS